ncbi:MAG: hypothetical protein BWY15_02124 [Firmicutes bacterium ADurb.Bin193]|nr:MAG: hypothetical protein BWY15_02124 [Firmicutes bacterium ADurb.Bin193]
MSEHFVKQTYGVMWHFCHNTGGICFCRMTSDHITEYEVLLSSGQKDFDVLIDDTDTIHLVCGDDSGSMIYISNRDKTWKKYTVMQSKTIEVSPKNFNIYRVGNWINVIYSIDYKGKRLLSHQILESSNPPGAIDYTEGEFCTTKDLDGNIYVLYNNQSGALGWRKFAWGKKEWSDFTAITAGEGLISPYIYVDDKIHIAGIRDDSVVYISDGTEHCLGTPGSGPIILKHGGLLYVMWENKRSGKVCVCPSSNRGASFQSPTEFVSGTFAPVKLYSLAHTSFENCFARHCYGYIRDNTVNLYLLGDYLNIKLSPPKPVMPTVQKDEGVELVKLKIQLQQLSEAVAKMGLRVDALEKKTGENSLNKKTEP